MKILIAGASGLIGTALSDTFRSKGHNVWRLVRNKAPSGKEISWDPEKGMLDSSSLEGFDAVINLSGESVAKPWSNKVKQEILNSRVLSTQLISNALAQLASPPSVFINASAVGIYGDTGEKICSESTPPGTGFLADVCVQWEAATAPAQLANIRTVHTRFGIVLSPKGGALAKMLLPFKLGLGGTIGSGDQYMSWVSIDDVVKVIETCVINNKLAGPINVVAPFPVKNADFTKALGNVLRRPYFFRIPETLLRWLAGEEMAKEFFFSSIRASPQKLLDAGYTFQDPDLETALKHLLNK